MTSRDRVPASAIAIGASAGGLEALVPLVGVLPPDLDAAVFVVVHVEPTSKSVIPEILSRAGPLTAKHPEDGEVPVSGQIYVAPPNCHLLVREGLIQLSEGPRENRSRPSIDVLFRAVAAEYGERAIGMVLSGMLSDGALGLEEIKTHGGMAMVQEPDHAIFSELPMNAIRLVSPEVVGTVETLAKAAVDCVRRTAESDLVAAAAGDRGELKVMDNPDSEALNASAHEQSGQITPLVCPDCGGTMWVERVGQLERFHCRVGHAYSEEAMVEAQSEALEAALWGAIVALEERADLMRRVGSHLTGHAAVRTQGHVRQAEQQAEAIRSALVAVVKGFTPVEDVEA